MSDDSSERIAVVIVTYNRLALLREALLAVGGSIRRIDAIIVVDNQSTDGTAQALATEFPHAQLIRPEQNVGSAGGYALGIQEAFDLGFDWIWTLDDDSIVTPTALAELLAARGRFPEFIRPNLLASKVVWTDGSLHPMNIQKPKLYDPALQLAAAEAGTMSIRFTSFVSMLVHRSLIARFGLPIAGYFLWNDDVEFSARILRTEPGVVVPASVVCHKTAMKHVPGTSAPEKFYYEIRNKLWIVRLSAAFARDEKVWMMRSLRRRSWRHLRENHFRVHVFSAVVRGVRDGLFRSPPVL